MVRNIALLILFIYFFSEVTYSGENCLKEKFLAFFSSQSIEQISRVIVRKALPINPEPLKKNYSETQFDFKVTGLSDYGEEKQRKMKLLENEREMGLKFLSSQKERDEYKLYVNNGLLYDAKGRPLDTKGDLFGFSYVMDKQGNIYFGHLHHPAYLEFAQVAAAGHIKVKNGVLLEANRSSGQYGPAPEFLDQFKLRLKELGVDTSHTNFNYEY